ncbi:hypothetical protein [Nocardioides hwasunensis]|uniref:Lipoprotein n=1 Tax=Nocardioides hwasunensis TaxID=397258 RepID=A0ABR8MA28_9ACTN|nr:hypothetical protein [Nocardioides hwasunensis]MBD3913014.1 hypothetical protein [Nocardioides hwasunensis]
MGASALCAGLLVALAGCGGSGTAAATKTTDAVLLGQQVQDLIAQVDDMGVVEWHGQMLTKNPDQGGKRIFDVAARLDAASGDSELSVTSSIDGKEQQIDYLLIKDRTYFNSDAWGPGAATCWADITGDSERTWALPADLDPSWALKAARAIKLDGKDVMVSLPYKQVLAGMPRGLFTDVPTVSYDTEAAGVISPHGPLIEVGVDVQSMWKKLTKEQRAELATNRTGWWAMTMRESSDDSAVAPPPKVFDPVVTPPSQCKRG